MTIDPTSLDVRTLVPHHPPILMIDRLLTHDDDKGSAEYRVSEANPLVDDSGTLNPLALVEVMAQTFAARNGCEVKLGLHKRINGMIAGIQGFNVYTSVNAGDLLTTECRKTTEIGNFAIMEGRIFREETLVADSQMKVWSSEKLPDRPKSQ